MTTTPPLETTHIVLHNLNPATNEACQRIVFKFGYGWGLERNQTITEPTKKFLYVPVNKEKGLMFSNEYSKPWGNESYYNIEIDHVDTLHLVLETLNKGTKPPPTPQPPQPKPTMTTPATNPYESMVADIRQRLLDELKDSLPNQERVKQLILEEVAKTSRVTVVLEDRRLEVPTTTELTGPVHQSMPELIGILSSQCWPALVGPTGSGKTLGVLQCAKLLGIQLVCIKQMTRIIAPHDLIGYMDANGHYRKGAWTDAILGYQFEANGTVVPNKLEHTPALIVVDEMDNANENIIMLVKALQTGRIAMPYGMQDCNSKLQVVATMNTWGTGATREYVGRCAQDAALLNEFQFIEWNYDTAFEWELLQQLFGSYKSTGDYDISHMRRLLDMFIAMRQKAEQQKIRVIISTRNVINVAKLLICNPTWVIHKALCMSVYKGLKEEEIKRVECPEMWRNPERAKKQMAKQAAIDNVECPI